MESYFDIKSLENRVKKEIDRAMELRDKEKKNAEKVISPFLQDKEPTTFKDNLL